MTAVLEHPPHPAQRVSWHLAGCLVQLRAAVNAFWPDRSKVSDGGIGDEAHQLAGSGSDHNPWLGDCVRAYDFTAEGINAGWLAENLRLLGAAGDERLVGGGYVIWDGQITSPDWTRWVDYHGEDAHRHHVHVSVSRTKRGYESSAPWSFLVHQPGAPAPQPAPAPLPAPPVLVSVPTGEDFRANFGDEGPQIGALQSFLNRYAPAYSHLVVDDVFGPRTAEVVREFAHRIAHDHTTPDADRVGLETADGRTVGPRLARALSRAGFHG